MNFDKLKHRIQNINPKDILKVAIYLFSASVAAIIVFIFLVIAGLFGRIPGRSELGRIVNPLASEVYSADGALMGKYYA